MSIFFFKIYPNIIYTNFIVICYQNIFLNGWQFSITWDFKKKKNFQRVSQSPQLCFSLGRGTSLLTPYTNSDNKLTLKLHQCQHLSNNWTCFCQFLLWVFCVQIMISLGVDKNITEILYQGQKSRKTTNGKI